MAIDYEETEYDVEDFDEEFNDDDAWEPTDDGGAPTRMERHRGCGVSSRPTMAVGILSSRGLRSVEAQPEGVL